MSNLTPSELRSQLRHRTRAMLLSTIVDPDRFDHLVSHQRASGATAIILELETGVVSGHDVARELVHRCLTTVDYGEQLRAVRVNPVDSGMIDQDLDAIMPGRPDAIMLTKVERAEEVKDIAERVSEREAALGLPSGSVRLWTMIESARSVLHCEEIASADDRLDLVCFGPGDFAADIGTRNSAGDEDLGEHAGIEAMFARGFTIAAARAAKRLVIDLAFRDVKRIEGLGLHARLSRQMGFDGMLALSPRQIPPLLEGFTPTAEEVDLARRTVSAFREATKSGTGVIEVDGQMVSQTISDQFEFVLERAGITLD